MGNCDQECDFASLKKKRKRETRDVVDVFWKHQPETVSVYFRLRASSWARLIWHISIIFLKHSSASFRMQSAHQQWWLTPLPALLAPGHVSGMEGSSGEVCGGKQLIPHSLSIPKDDRSLEWFVKSTAMLTRLAECKQLRRQSWKICNFKSERSGSGTWKEVHLDKVKPSRSWNPPKRWWWSW